MEDWAETRAREWLDKEGVKLSGYSCVLEDNLWVEADERAEMSLAVLLCEVQEPYRTALAALVEEIEREYGEQPNVPAMVRAKGLL